MRTVAIIQARMGSTRLPGKVLKSIGGETMLARTVRRTQRATLLDEVIIATTVEEADQAIVAESKRLGIKVFRGDEQDVLDRYYQAAKVHDAEVVVRITSDCPLIDPKIIDKVIGAFYLRKVDYASNSLVRTYPRGLDVEVMTFATLACAWNEAKESFERIHVTPYIYQNPCSFRLLSIATDTDYSGLRWTVDTLEDLELVRKIYQCFTSDEFSWKDVLRLLTQNPELSAINSHIRQKSLQEG